ncbi:HWE histidine kinase domain-containing protein [Devosia epidermidihirudinis]|nr:PAS domain-containing sensor histidine kinase [Devosia epidermidihirudinis]
MATLHLDRQTHTMVRTLSQGLSSLSIAVLHQDADGVFDFSENLPSFWPGGPAMGQTPAGALPPHLAVQFVDARTKCLASGEEQSFEFELLNGTQQHQFSARTSLDEGSVIFVMSDITDTVARNAAFASLLREVSHRSKNLLAIVQSMSMQTANHSESIADFLAKFRGRLHALASTQDLVTESNWRGTHFRSLVNSQIRRLGVDTTQKLRIIGDNPVLNPNASLHVGLAIHELAANARLYGALADDGDSPGQIEIEASIVPDSADGSNLVIEWDETGIHHNARHHVPRFGTLVLERIAPLSVGGTARLNISRSGVTYRLIVPPDQFEA